MATLPSSTTKPNSKTLTLNTSSLFVQSYNTLSSQSPQPLPSLSDRSLLPPLSPDLPHSKLIPKTRFIIDGFRHAGPHSVSYFLSHFHSDHYTGLNPNWSKGLIFCSELTSRLLIDSLKVSPLFIVSLPLRERIIIDGCDVTLVDANHCPGAVQFMFKVPGVQSKDERYIHTGDFRFSNSMKLDPLLYEFVGADAIYLDTTYCNPKFVFPSQVDSVNYVVDTVERIRRGNEKVLFIIATYVVGKEKILLEISKRCGCMIHVDSRKMSILRTLGFGESKVFTEDALVTDVHVVGWNVLGETWPYFRPNFTKMKEMMVEKGYEKAVGIVPTGWMYEAKKDGFAVRSKGSLEIHLVPYSEHSSYEELREYVRFLRPKRVIPTVGMDVEKLDSKHAITMRKHFAGLVDEMANKQEFLMGFHRKSQSMDVKGADDASIDVNEEFDKKDELNSVENMPETHNKTALGIFPENTFSLQEPLSNSDVPKNEDKEEMIQQLCDCLPKWVTRDQKLDLLTRSHGDIVEAVSDFYERETEFHQQIAACTKSDGISAINLNSDSSLVPELASNKAPLHGRVTTTSSQDKRSTILKHSVKSKTSPKKRSAGPEKVPNKRGKSNLKSESSGSKQSLISKFLGGKSNSTLESSGPKQSTITKFFSKLVHNTSQAGEIDSATATTGEHPEDGNTQVQNGASEPYTEQLDKFLQVLNNVSRNDATSILEKAKGDLNVALDIYYSTLGDKFDGEGDLSCGTRSVENVCSPAIELKLSDERIVSRSNLLSPGIAVNNSNATLMLLPLEKYSPSEHACWKSGQPAPYLHIARTFDMAEGERGKIKATSMLCNMFRSLLALSPKDVLPAVYLCTNKIAPDHKNMELNIGGSMITAAIEEACGTNKITLREMYNNLGDLGDVAQVCRQKQTLLAPHCALTIQEVFSALRKISSETGSGSTTRKKNLIVNLMRSCREKEIKFLVRTLVRNLRIGAMMRTVLPALAQAVLIHSCPEYLQEGSLDILKDKLQSISVAVIEAYNMLPDLDLLVPALLNKGIEFSSSTLSMVPGVPIKPMLARITNGTSQALKLFQGRGFTCEFKYDGQRAQIHRLDDGSLRVYSRNGDETTTRFPDLLNIIEDRCNPTAVTFIVDAEVVAVDRKNGCKLMSFQELSSRDRGSKNSLIALNNIKIDICVFVFDIMFANGEGLLGFPLRQRRRYFKDLFHEEKLGYFEYAKEITVEAEDACLGSQETLTRINSFLEDAFRSSCEGIMVKSLDVDAGYAASKRTDAWLKVKRDYLEGMNDSLDLVPIGAWHGNGRKAGWYSPYLMACYNPDTEEFQSVCRVMSGFSDSFYKEMKEFFCGERILSRKPPYYQTAEVPDHWFSPELVWEIRGADFTVSPVHHAAIGLVHPSRGISIRFPRFIRTLSDRKAEDCSTAGDLADIFQLQTRKMDKMVRKSTKVTNKKTTTQTVAPVTNAPSTDLETLFLW